MTARFTLAVLTASALACTSTSPVAHRNEVRMVQVENNTPGTLWLQATGHGRNEATAVLDSEKAAFTGILFRGIPGSAWTRPLVADEAASRREHDDFYATFLDGRGYAGFILASRQGPLNKVQGWKRLENTLHVDMNGLRQHLEQHKIIRPFGL